MTDTALPRLAPLPRAQWDDDVRAALARAFSEKVADQFFAAGEMPNVLGTLMHNPALMGPFLAYNNVLLREPALGHRLRELIILRVAVRTRAPYEWAQHVRMAGTVGVTPEEIAATAHRRVRDCSELESDVLAATDQLIDGYRVDDPTWARLAEQLDARQLVELVFVVGTYTALAMAFNSFGLQLDADLQSITPLPEFEE